MYDEQPQAALEPEGLLSLTLSALASLLLHVSVAAWAAQQSLQTVDPQPFEVELVALSTPEPSPQEEPDAPTPTLPPRDPQAMARQAAAMPQTRPDVSPGDSRRPKPQVDDQAAGQGPEEPPAPTPTAPPPDFARNLERELPDERLPRNVQARALAEANSYGTGGKDARLDGTSTKTQGAYDHGIGPQIFLNALPGREHIETDRISPISGTADEKRQEAARDTQGSGLGGNRLELALEVPDPLDSQLAQGRLTSNLSASPLSGPVENLRAPGPLKDEVQQGASASGPVGPILIQSGQAAPQHEAQRAQGDPATQALRPPPPPTSPLEELPQKTQLNEAAQRRPALNSAPEAAEPAQARKGRPSGNAPEARSRPVPTLLPPHEGATPDGKPDSDQARDQRARPAQEQRQAPSRSDVPLEEVGAANDALVAAIPLKTPTGPAQRAASAQANSSRGAHAAPEVKGETNPTEQNTADKTTRPMPTPSPAPDPKEVRQETAPTPPPPGTRPERTPEPVRQPPEERQDDNVSPPAKSQPPRPDASSPLQKDQQASGGMTRGVGLPDGEKGRELTKHRLLGGIFKGTAAPGREYLENAGIRGEDQSGLGKKSLNQAGETDVVSGSQVASLPRPPRFDAASNLDTQESKYWRVSSEIQHRLDTELRHEDVYGIRRIPEEGMVTFCLQIHANGKVGEGEIWPVDGMDQALLVAVGDRALRAILKRPLSPFPQEWEVDVLLMKVEINFHVNTQTALRRKTVKCEQRAVGGTPPKLKSPQPSQPVRPLPGMPRIDIDQPDLLPAPGRPVLLK